MNEQVEWTLRWATPGGAPITVLMVIATLGIVFVGLWELRSVEQRTRRWWLATLRIASAAGLLLLGLQPACSGQQVAESEGRLALLIDVSRSMSVADDGLESRAAQVQAVLQRWQLASPADMEVYAFGRDITQVDLPRWVEAYPATEDDTRLLDAVRSIADQERSEELGAIVVVSDGADRSSREGLDTIAELGVRVHSVAAGRPTQLADQAISAVRVDGRAFLREPTQVEVVLRASGGLGGRVPVTLYRGQERIHEIEVELSHDQPATATFELSSNRLGSEAYQVAIPVDPRDAVPDNNRRAFLLDVVRDRLRVLLVCGHPSWDARFLRGHLKSDPSIDLITFFILRTAHDAIEASPEELSLIPFPTEELFDQHLDSFDVVIFQDFDFAPYRMARHLPKVRDYVRKGGAFAMLGGERSLASGGYAKTPIAEVLPVALAPRAYAQVSEASFSPRVVSAARWHPLLSWYLDAESQRAAWQRLAPLAGMNLVERAQPDATVLLVHPSLKTPEGASMPLLALGEPGDGRSLVLATDTAWRWGFTTAGHAGDASAYALFWDRALRWLARDPALEPTQIELDQALAAPAGSFAVRVRARDTRYEPLAFTAFEIAIEDPQNETLRTLRADSNAEGIIETRIEVPALPGAYRLVIREAKENAPALAERSFVVEAGGDELADPQADHAWLAEISERTGGRAYVAGQAPNLSDLTTSQPRIVGVVERKPCSEAWYVVMLLALLAGEWTARRAWGRT